MRVGLRNRSAARVERVKLLVEHLGNKATYATLPPQQRSLVKTVGPLAPGATVPVAVGPFRPFHFPPGAED